MPNPEATVATKRVTLLLADGFGPIDRSGLPIPSLGCFSVSDDTLILDACDQFIGASQ